MRPSEPESQLQAARRLNPEFWGIYYYLAKLRLKMKRASEAVP